MQQFARSFSTQPEVQVRNHNLIGISDVKVLVVVKRVIAAPSWAQALSLPSHFTCDYSAEQSDAPDDGSLLLLSQYRQACQHQLVGAQVVTDHYGIARFTELAVEYGPEGVYELEFLSSVETQTARLASLHVSQLHYILMQSQVASVTVSAADPSLPLPIRLPFRTPLAPFRVLLSDASGHPLSNRTVRVISSPRLVATPSATLAAVRGVPSVEVYASPQRLALLLGASARTDDSGAALFDSVQLLGSQSMALYLALSVEGQLLNLGLTASVPSNDLSNALGPSPLDSDPSAVSCRLVKSPPASILEMQPLGSLVVQLTDPISGAALAGVPVFAEITSWNGASWNPLGQYRYSFAFSAAQRRAVPQKRLLNVVTTTDATGVANFSALTFSSAGSPGNYTVVLAVDGVHLSASVFSCIVDSQVHSLQVLWPVSAQLFALFLQDFPLFPLVTVLDPQGTPVAGKVPLLHIIGGDAIAIAIHSVGLATDLDGVGAFSKLQVMFANATSDYLLAFSVDGVRSSQVFQLQVLEINSTLGYTISPIPINTTNSNFDSSNVDSSNLLVKSRGVQSESIVDVALWNPFRKQPHTMQTCSALVLIQPTELPIQVQVGQPFPKLVFQALPIPGGNLPVANPLHVQLALGGDGVEYALTGNFSVTAPSSDQVMFQHVTVPSGYSSSLALYAYSPHETYCTSTAIPVVLVNPIGQVLLAPDTPSLVQLTAGNTTATFDFVLLDQQAAPLTGGTGRPSSCALELLTAPCDQYRGLGIIPAAELYSAEVTLEGAHANATVQLGPLLQLYAGFYSWSFSCDGVVSPSVLSVQLINQIASVQLVEQNTLSNPGDVALGTPINPVLQMLDASGAPAQGYRVGAYPCGMNLTSFFFGANRADILGSPWSTPSDPDGTVFFPDLVLWQGIPEMTHEICFAHLFFEQAASPMLPTLLPAQGAFSFTLPSFSLAIQIVKQPPRFANSGVPLHSVPAIEINVTDAGNSSHLLPLFAAGIQLASSDAIPSWPGFQPTTLAPCTLLADASSPAYFLLNPAPFPFLAANATTLPLSPLTLVNAKPGSYGSHFVAPGAGEVSARGIQVVPFAVWSEVQVQPPSVVVLGQSFLFEVQVFAIGGQGLAGKVVRVALWGASGRFESQIDPARALSVTDGQGVARFELAVSAAADGSKCSVQYWVLGDLGLAAARESRPFTVWNPIAHMSVVTPPVGLWRQTFWANPMAYIFSTERDRSYALSTGDTGAAAGSLRQPLVCLSDHQGQPIAGFPVSIQARSAVALVNDSSVLEPRGAFQLIFTWGNRDQVTDDTGCLQFSAVRVRPGYSGAFWPSFHAAGMRVQSSDLLEVYNPQEPEQQIEENSEAGAFLLAALLIPLFFANSLWITNPVVITGSLLLGIVVLSWFLAIRCLVFVSLAQQTNLDGITLSWQIYVFLFLVATWVTVVRVALLYWLGKDEKYFYEFRRMRIYIRHVKKLLNPNHDAQGYDFEQEPGIKALLGMERAWRWFRVKVMRCCPCCNCFLFRCGCCEHGPEATRPHWESHTEHPYVSFHPDSEIDRIDDEGDIDDVAHENVLPPDRQFRGSRAPHPNRLTAHTACGWRLRSMCCPIVRADAYMGEDDWVYSQRFISAMLMSALALVYCFLWSVWAVRRFESFMIQFQGWAVFLKVWTERVIQLLLGNSELASEVFNAYILTYVGLFFDFAASADQHLDYLFTWSGLTAAALSFVIICVVWMDIIGAYKSFIVKFRRGEMRKIFREHSFHVGNASRYVGVQTGHVLFGYFLLFFTLWITLIIFSSHWIRKLMLESFFALFIWLLGLHLALTIIRLTLTNFVLTHGFDLRYPRFYFFWDFINSFAEVLAGLATTLLRLGVALGGMIATFTRIHLPLLGWTTLEGFDAGYSSFISMVYADHLYNNPVLNVFVYLLVQQQRNWHLEQASSPATTEDPSDDEFSAAELKYSRFSRVVRSIKTTLGRLSSPSIPPPPTDPFQREIYLRRRRAVFRWQLAYCLLRNPSIRKYRRNLSKPLDFYHPRVNPLAPPISQPYQVIDSDAASPPPLSRSHEIRESAAHHSLDSIQVQIQW